MYKKSLPFVCMVSYVRDGGWRWFVAERVHVCVAVGCGLVSTFWQFA